MRRNVLLVVHELLKNEKEDLGNVFQIIGLLLRCHLRSGNLVQGVSLECVGVSVSSILLCSASAGHRSGSGYLQWSRTLQCRFLMFSM